MGVCLVDVCEDEEDGEGVDGAVGEGGVEGVHHGGRHGEERSEGTVLCCCWQLAGWTWSSFSFFLLSILGESVFPVQIDLPGVQGV